jgi:hypothetical protein
VDDVVTVSYVESPSPIDPTYSYLANENVYVR